MYEVLITDSAIEANPAAAKEVETDGNRKSFQSKQAAEEFAEQLSRGGTRLQIQRVAPQETRDINAYLVPNPEKHIWEPKESEKQGFTFDTTANQYGEIGEAVVSGDYGVAPGLQYYLKQDIDTPEAEYKITCRQDTRIPSSIDYNGSWIPDLVVDIKQREDWSTIATYFCEMKSGDASFQRRQREGMESLAETHRVLTIRVDIENLPSEYTLRIDTVDTSS